MKSVFHAGADIQNTLCSLNGHSIARPIAFGNRVPPQRTVLGETSRPLVLAA